MRILFFMRHEGYVRNFEETLRLLAERGHDVCLAFDDPTPSWLASQEPLKGLADTPHIETTRSPSRLGGVRGAVAENLRRSLDYMRYLGPAYAEAPKLRRRAAKRVPKIVRRFGRSPLARHHRARSLVTGVLSALERSLGAASETERFLEARRPDVVLITPFVGFGSDQIEYLRAARRRSIPVGVCVASWDNLTNKGLVRDSPDLVTVWNEGQREEAIRLHGIPPERVVATGAQAYDHWFEWTPSCDVATFCDRAGLDPARPFVLYVCSSPFVAPEEVSFVCDWLSRLRSCPSPLRDVGVLVRPHPQNAAQWNGVLLDERFGNADVWPKGGQVPVSPDSRSDYFDSIYHCRAVVGLNTSALIESAIIGRPVFTVLDERYRETQGGTLHFGHLTAGDSPLLTVAASFEEHVRQLEPVVRGDATPLRNLAFLETFVRPHGLDRPAAPILAESVERLRAVPQESLDEPPRVVAWLAQALVAGLVAFQAGVPLERRIRKRLRHARRRTLFVGFVVARKIRLTVLGAPSGVSRHGDEG